jgi:hypothetical protein
MSKVDDVTEVDDGGSAFPMLPPKTEAYQTWPAHPGMTLRDYFAAHAPAVPQDWFTPVMPASPTCPALPAYGGPWTRELIDRARLWLNDSAGADLIAFMPQTITDDQRAAVEAFESTSTEANAALKAWFGERKKQTYVQWPYAWADEQLKIR